MPESRLQTVQASFRAEISPILGYQLPGGIIMQLQGETMLPLQKKEGRKSTHPWQPTKLNGWNSAICSNIWQTIKAQPDPAHEHRQYQTSTMCHAATKLRCLCKLSISTPLPRHAARRCPGSVTTAGHCASSSGKLQSRHHVRTGARCMLSGLC